MPNAVPVPRQRRLPRAGVFRLHPDPAALPPPWSDGVNRFDDPRPRSLHTFRVRYTASTLRGCLLESLAWLRRHTDAAAAEALVIDNADPSGAGDAPGESGPRAALEEFLADRQVAIVTGRRLRILSINDPALQAALDREPAVRALLDSADGRAALSAPGHRPRLDEAAVRLSTAFGRELTQACSLAPWDRSPRPDGIHHRSRHDDDEDCWAIYDHAPVTVRGVIDFTPNNEQHRAAVSAVAILWDLELPPAWS